ncbi:MAG: hypothetical protein OZ921_15365 [Sorangiineae bacterium]|nr:hypothetical protein [Polyangiaceae bacterium]MEB2323890.1 hypothetical protein [Sorangiineae bacterium]
MGAPDVVTGALPPSSSSQSSSTPGSNASGFSAAISSSGSTRASPMSFARRKRWASVASTPARAFAAASSPGAIVGMRNGRRVRPCSVTRATAPSDVQ